MDGTTAVALLYKYLKNKCENPEYYIPDRYTEGYGVSILAIDYAARNGITLMIVTDCGVKAVEKVRYAKSKGVDVIICDHHTPGDELPGCRCRPRPATERLSLSLPVVKRLRCQLQTGAGI